jgi:hypothetical protein
VLTAQLPERRVAEVVDHLVALQHLAENGEQVGLAGPKGAVDVDIAIVVQTLTDGFEQHVETVTNLVSNDVLANVLANAVVAVRKTRDERIEIGVDLATGGSRGSS